MIRLLLGGCTKDDLILLRDILTHAVDFAMQNGASLMRRPVMSIVQAVAYLTKKIDTLED